MAPTTSTTGAGGGGNPAPLYKEKSNAIAALMSRHTSAPSLSFLSSLPPRNSTSGAPIKKTAAQQAAELEDYELDRLAQYDDNMGVGMFAPENRKEKEAKRQKELEAQRLRKRLGIKDNKRKGAEWDGVSGAARARGQPSDDEEEEMGRSAVGRAKKRKRPGIPDTDDLDESLDAVDVKDTPETGHAEPRQRILAGSSPKAAHARGNGHEKSTQENESIVEANQAISSSVVEVDDNLDTEMSSKRKRKKKRRNKPKA